MMKKKVIHQPEVFVQQPVHEDIQQEEDEYEEEVDPNAVPIISAKQWVIYDLKNKKFIHEVEENKIV